MDTKTNFTTNYENGTFADIKLCDESGLAVNN